jgi:hypothetical protein
LPDPSLITEPAKIARMISITKRGLMVKEIKEAGWGFGEFSDQKSAAPQAVDR